LLNMSIKVGINGFGRIGRIVRIPHSPTLFILALTTIGLQKRSSQQERSHRRHQ